MTLLATAGVSFCFAQNFSPDRNCSYPSSLKCADGKTVKNAKQWERVRRPELISLYETEVYGKMPDVKVTTSYETLSCDSTVLGGTATKKEVKASFRANGMERHMVIVMYIPNSAKKPVPVLVGMNFDGNYKNKGENTTPNEVAIGKGFAVATINTESIYPESKDGYDASICKMLYEGSDIPEEQRCGALGAWAWGLSRAMDYMETDEALDASKTAVFGHSRTGKCALWAGATDPRFAMVVSNNSGCGGAALFRCKTGENIRIITTAFPYWFCGNFQKYAGNEKSLPVDQNNLLALVAPRLLYVASASEDSWADPWGEFKAASLAGKVYGLYGYDGLGDRRMPSADSPVFGDRIGYHLRTGQHDITLYDWTQYVGFADKYFNK